MRAIKYMLFFVLGAGYATGWWAAAVFGMGSRATTALWVIPFFTTILLIIVCLGNLYDNWNKE